MLLLNMLDKSVSLTSTYLHFCARKRLNASAGDFWPHLGARNRLDAPAGDFCLHLAARKRLDAPAGDTVDQSVVFSHSIGFPSLGCKTVYREHSRKNYRGRSGVGAVVVSSPDPTYARVGSGDETSAVVQGQQIRMTSSRPSLIDGPASSKGGLWETGKH